MLITVKIIQGKECTIEVSTGSSISNVKQIVAQQLQIPVDQQRLVFKGKTLADGLSLCDYNIVDGNKLHLFILKNEVPSTDSEPHGAATTVLWDELSKFLEKHFSTDDTKRVLQEFKKNFEKTHANLSLDDIERLATHCLGGGGGSASRSGV